MSVGNDLRESEINKDKSRKPALRAVGWIGVLVAMPFFVWAPLGFVSLVPSMIDVFGIVGLRIPAGITIAGLLIAAVGFYED